MLTGQINQTSVFHHFTVCKIKCLIITIFTEMKSLQHRSYLCALSADSDIRAVILIINYQIMICYNLLVPTSLTVDTAALTGGGGHVLVSWYLILSAVLRVVDQLQVWWRHC